VRAVVADDQLLTREGIVRLLVRAGVEVVGEAADGEAVLALVASLEPDVVLLDVRMPPTHTDEGLRAATEIRRRHPGTGVVILSQYVEVDFVMAMLDSGASSVGYLVKDRVLDLATLVDALRRVTNGECVIDPTIVRELLRRKRRADPLDLLTERERDVLSLVAEGLSNRAIAQQLYIGERTVEVHTRHVFSKLGLPEDDLNNRRVLAALTYLRRWE
jgi:DNA-binding NarL/FixJ family response regulator